MYQEDDAGHGDLDQLSFEEAELDGQSGGLACTFCSAELRSMYFEVNETATCEKCRYEIEKLQTAGSGIARIVRAGVAGLGAAAVGAGIYYAVLELTGYKIGLIAIAVGFLVGGAVRWGSQGRGGWLYQLLAVGLTYVAIVSTYVPTLLQAMNEELGGEQVIEEMIDPLTEIPEGQLLEERGGVLGEAIPAIEEMSVVEQEQVDVAPAAEMPVEEMGAVAMVMAAGLFFLLVLAIPFLAGFENVIGLLIIFFALWQAWSMNRRSVLEITGPFEVGKPPPAPVPALDA